MFTRVTALVFTAVMTLGLTGCIRPYHVNVQQGNLISEKQIAQLKPGMSKQRVESLLGKSLVNNIYKSNRMVYVYTDKPQHGKFIVHKLIVHFRGNRLTHVDSTYDDNFTLPLPAEHA